METIVLVLTSQHRSASLISAVVAKAILLALSSLLQSIVHQVPLGSIVESVKAMINVVILIMADVLLALPQAIVHLAAETQIVITLTKIIIALVGIVCSALRLMTAEMMLLIQDVTSITTLQLILARPVSIQVIAIMLTENRSAFLEPAMNVNMIQTVS